MLDLDPLVGRDLRFTDATPVLTGGHTHAEQPACLLVRRAHLMVAVSVRTDATLACPAGATQHRRGASLDSFPALMAAGPKRATQGGRSHKARGPRGPLTVAIAHRVMAIGAERGWSEEELASELGITRGDLWRYREGKQAMGVERLDQIALRLGVHPIDLVAADADPLRAEAHLVVALLDKPGLERVIALRAPKKVEP